MVLLATPQSLLKTKTIATCDCRSCANVAVDNVYYHAIVGPVAKQLHERIRAHLLSDGESFERRAIALSSKAGVSMPVARKCLSGEPMGAKSADRIAKALRKDGMALDELDEFRLIRGVEA